MTCLSFPILSHTSATPSLCSSLSPLLSFLSVPPLFSSFAVVFVVVFSQQVMQCGTFALLAETSGDGGRELNTVKHTDRGKKS